MAASGNATQKAKKKHWRKPSLLAPAWTAPAWTAPALAAALREGRVDGTVYSGKCACLCGTIANARQCDVNSLVGIQPDSSRPAEVFFMAIRPGDTPEKSPIAKLALEWVEDFQRLISGLR